MGNVIIDENILKNIADSIRQKGGTSQPIKVSEMPAAINDLFLPDNFAYIGMVESTLNLARDTTWNSVTPNTTASTTIRPITNSDYGLKFAETVDSTRYNLLIFHSADVNYSWKDEGIMPKIEFCRFTGFQLWRKTNRFNGFPLDNDNVTPTYALNYPVSTHTNMYLRTVSGAFAQNASSTMGIIATTPTSPTVRTTNNADGTTESTSSSGRYISSVAANAPAISVRLHDSNFNMNTFRNVDAENTNIVRKLLVFKTPKGNTMWERILENTMLCKPVEDLVK